MLGIVVRGLFGGYIAFSCNASSYIANHALLTKSQSYEEALFDLKSLL